jgi:rhamnosyltransferase
MIQRDLKASLNHDHAEIAVVLHLFYVENWPLFSQRLNNLTQAQIGYDLFITLPAQLEGFITQIKIAFPNAHCIVTPNRGRDVLPFIKVAEVLSASGYHSILKFHSKKSTHWEGGQDWLEGMMERLLPSDGRAIGRTIALLQEPTTGVIGPSDVYYPLTVNFPANGPHMMRIVSKLYGKNKAHEVLQQRRKEYGFFGGTMFWARLDAIEPLLQYPVRAFEAEHGQIDATFAHALERMFCIVPEITQRDMYELTVSGKLRKRPYKSTDIPEWSTDHDK